MAEMTKIVGAAEIKRNLRKAGKAHAWHIRKGLTRAGFALQRWSQQIVPIDTANLKNSAGTEVEGHGWATRVAVFYTSAYAVYVHERTDLRHAPGKTSKYLEKPARERRGDLLKIIAGGKASRKRSIAPKGDAGQRQALEQRIAQLGG